VRAGDRADHQVVHRDLLSTRRVELGAHRQQGVHPGCSAQVEVRHRLLALGQPGGYRGADPGVRHVGEAAHGGLRGGLRSGCGDAWAGWALGRRLGGGRLLGGDGGLHVAPHYAAAGAGTGELGQGQARLLGHPAGDRAGEDALARGRSAAPGDRVYPGNWEFVTARGLAVIVDRANGGTPGLGRLGGQGVDVVGRVTRRSDDGDRGAHLDLASRRDQPAVQHPIRLGLDLDDGLVGFDDGQYIRDREGSALVHRPFQ